MDNLREDFDIVPELSQKIFENVLLNKKPTELTPLQWTEFFDRKELIQTNDEDYFNVYFKGSTGPLFYLIHGGGYSALTWACFVVRYFLERNNFKKN